MRRQTPSSREAPLGDDRVDDRMKTASKSAKEKNASNSSSKVHRVVELGRERKYVPAGEGESFGPDPTSVEEINSVISMLGDGEAEIAVEMSEESPFNAEAEDEKDEEWVPDVAEDKEEKEEQEDRSLLRDSSDPVRMYLQEMGGVALLSREDEVVIAKSIEAGELEVRKAVFSLPLALQYVLNLADRLRDGEIDGRHLFGDEEEEPANAEGAPRARGRARHRVPQARLPAASPGERAREARRAQVRQEADLGEEPQEGRAAGRRRSSRRIHAVLAEVPARRAADQRHRRQAEGGDRASSTRSTRSCAALRARAPSATPRSSCSSASA